MFIMVEFKIAPSNTGIIAQTFKKIKEITASGSIDIDTPVRILLAAGKYPGILGKDLRFFCSQVWCQAGRNP